MSKLQLSPIRLNVINKKKPDLRISIIVGASLSISHLKRKIQTEFDELYSQQVVIKLIEDERGFIISNNSIVEEHFSSGDTVYFLEHDRNQKSTGFTMNMPNNLGEILSTVRFMTGSALQKLDKVDLKTINVMELVPEFLHMGFWYSNDTIVGKVYKIFNKIFGQDSIEKYVCGCSEVQMNLLLKNFLFWLVEIPSAILTHHEIVWELLQLFQKFSANENFAKMIKNHTNSSGTKIMKIIQDLSRDVNIPSQFKKISMRALKNIGGGGSRNGTGLGKIKSAYIPSMLGSSTVNAYEIQELLTTLKEGSPDDKLTVLQEIAASNFQVITEASVRFDLYEKMIMGIFSIKKIKNRKHITIFNQAINKVLANSSKDHCIEIMQKDIMKKIHSFVLEAPVEVHSISLELLGKICRVATASGMFNLQKSNQFLSSPYLEFQLLMSECIGKTSEQLSNISSLRFIPGIKDYVKTSLKTTNQTISLNLLKALSNLCLDEQCRYQIINLKGIQIFIKFLETAGTNTEICRVCGKGLLNLTISSRQNKAKVLGLMGSILQKFYQGKYDSVTSGYIQTIMKSRNI